jgi:hypothetical protein
MSPADVVIWLFLGIFFLTALIALASLPNWIRVGDYYKKKLFQLLILEVVACIVGFATQSVRSYRPGNGQDLQAILLSQEAYGWDWQYAAKNWKSRFRFERAGENKDKRPRLKLVGTTAVVKQGADDVPIITWETIEPFAVVPDAKSVTLKVRRTWTRSAAEIYPEVKDKAEKGENVEITLRMGWALEGSATDGWGPQWGIMLTSGFPR